MNGLVVVPIHHAIADPSHLAYILHSCHIKVIRWFSDFFYFFIFLVAGVKVAQEGDIHFSYRL